MSNILPDTTTTTEPTIKTPDWATKTSEPEDGSHSGEITVGPVTLYLEQIVHFGGAVEPMYVWMPEAEQIGGAQECRDLAAALMEAARVIDNA
jgi:hypothetical protein